MRAPRPPPSPPCPSPPSLPVDHRAAAVERVHQQAGRHPLGRAQQPGQHVPSPGFEAPSAWRIEWAFDCSNFADHGGGNFKITGDGAFQQIQVEKTDVYATGTEPLTRGGFGHLYVETVCERWTVRALSG